MAHRERERNGKRDGKREVARKEGRKGAERVRVIEKDEGGREVGCGVLRREGEKQWKRWK